MAACCQFLGAWSLDPASYRSLAADFGHPSFRNDLRRSDRTLWRDEQEGYSPYPMSGFSGQTPIGGFTVTKVTRALGTYDGPKTALACGDRLVRNSVALSYQQLIGDLRGTIYLLRRGGHNLLWGPVAAHDRVFRNTSARARSYPRCRDVIVSSSRWKRPLVKSFLIATTRPEQKPCTTES
jgi:hypothetical protein